jgi:hypothetical protein
VFAATTRGNTLYIGGSFTRLGAPTGSLLATNAAGTAQPATLPRVYGESSQGAKTQVHTVIEDGSGGWYVGGSFTRIGNFHREGLAHILANGSVDPAFNAATVNSFGIKQFEGARAMLLTGGRLYVASEYGSVVALDPKTGQAVISPVIVNGSVATMVVHENELLLGGYFLQVAGHARAGLAALSLSDLSLLPLDGHAEGANGDTPEVDSLAVSGNTVYVGGQFSHIGSQERHSLAQLNLSTGDATSWNPFSFQNNNSSQIVSSVAIQSTTVYIGGSFVDTELGPIKMLAAFSSETAQLDTSFTPEPVATQLGLVGPEGVTIVPSSAGLYVTGPFSSVGGQTRGNAALLNPSTGAALSWNPDPSEPPSAIIPTTSGAIIAGRFSFVDGVARNGLAAIDLTTGEATSFAPQLCSECSGTFVAPPPDVSSLAVDGNTIYFTGYFSKVDGEARPNTAAVNLETESITSWQPTFNVSGIQLVGIYSSGGELFVSGDFTSVEGQPRTGIASVSPTTAAPTAWDPELAGQHAGIPPVGDVISDGTTTYLSGSFTEVDGSKTPYLAATKASDGSLISTFKPEADQQVYGLALDPSLDRLYATGNFQHIGGVERPYVAALSATSGHNVSAWTPAELSSELTEMEGCPGAVFLGVESILLTCGLQFDSATGADTEWNPPHIDVVAIGATSLPGGGVYTGNNYESSIFRPLTSVPTNLEAPQLIGTPTVGSSITCDPGLWEQQGSLKLSLLRNDVPIATGSSPAALAYTVTSSDEHHIFGCSTESINAIGSSQVITGPTVSVIAESKEKEEEKSKEETKGEEKTGGGTGGGSSGGGTTGGGTTGGSTGGGTSTASTGASTSPVATISSAALVASLLQQLTPSGKNATIPSLLKTGSFLMPFTALEPGSVTISWYELPAGATLAKKSKAKRKPVLVASGRAKFSAAGTETVKLKLTTAGKKLLKHSSRLKLTAKATFTPTGKTGISTTRTFSLVGRK